MNSLSRTISKVYSVSVLQSPLRYSTALSARQNWQKKETAYEDEFFIKQQKEQLKKMKTDLEQEISFHEEQIMRHQEALDRHRHRVDKIDTHQKEQQQKEEKIEQQSLLVSYS